MPLLQIAVTRHAIRHMESILSLEEAAAALRGPLANQQRIRSLITLGKALPQLQPAHWSAACRVEGCQSLLVFRLEFPMGRAHLEVGTDALITAGLAALCVLEVQGRSPGEVARYQGPDLVGWGLEKALSTGRQQGLEHLVRSVRLGAAKHLALQTSDSPHRCHS